ncbi:hypothetical protein VNI00_018060 [Paramarasmius palmivorus]|uniref:Non-specific serine/threonine protein kinase n=1 Tax=Paramarasmius palmivorus TaxID=297713 RepID=A0AAW0B1G2_9AGAR
MSAQSPLFAHSTRGPRQLRWGFVPAAEAAYTRNTSTPPPILTLKRTGDVLEQDNLKRRKTNAPSAESDPVKKALQEKAKLPRKKAPSMSTCLWMSVEEGLEVKAFSINHIDPFLVKNEVKTDVFSEAVRVIRCRLGFRYDPEDVRAMCSMWWFKDDQVSGKSLQEKLVTTPLAELAERVAFQENAYTWNDSPNYIRFIFTVPKLPSLIVNRIINEWSDEDRILSLYDDYRASLGIVLQCNERGEYVVDTGEEKKGIVECLPIPQRCVETTTHPWVQYRALRVEYAMGEEANQKMKEILSASSNGSEVIERSPSPNLCPSADSIRASSTRSGSPSRSSDSQYGVIDNDATDREQSAWQPSIVSKPDVQNDVQNSPRYTLNGRHSLAGGDRQAPFIGLFCDIFVEYEQTRKRYKRGKAKFSWQFQREVHLLTVSLMNIQTGGNAEQRRLEDIRGTLGSILGVKLSDMRLENGSKPDLVHLILAVGHTSIVIEIKAEFASTIDPFVQSGSSYISSVQSVWTLPALASTCAPAFLLAIAGQFISIGAAVLTSRTIIQPLHKCGYYSTAYIAYPTDNSKGLHSLCCTFLAMREAIQHLNNFYNTIVNPPCDPRLVVVGNPLIDAHQRFFPWPKSFIYTDSTNRKQRIHFRYICPLTNSGSCVTFKVQLVPPPTPDQDSHPLRDTLFRAIPNASWDSIVTGTLNPMMGEHTQLVVKFVMQYGIEAHRHMATVERAPALISFDDFALTGGYLDMKMVVMEFVDGHNLAGCMMTDDLVLELEASMSTLHLAGFVHGDIRRENLMLTRDGRVMFVDFDTSCTIKHRKATVPITGPDDSPWEVQVMRTTDDDLPTFPPTFSTALLRIAQVGEDGFVDAMTDKHMFEHMLQSKE